MTAADLVLKNANVITMVPVQPAARMLAVRGDRIVFVGDDKEADSVTGLQTRVIDCGGKTLLPGFNDAHCHIFSLVRRLLSIDISPAVVRSITDIKAVIYRHAQGTPPGQWLVCGDYNDFYLAEKRHPDRHDIDEVVPHHPVVLTHRSLHACVLNSLGLRLTGITAETPEPPGGLIERDLTGEPTGRLFEMVGYIREKVLPPLSEEDLSKGISLANEYYLANGITSLQDATVVNDYARWQTFRRLKEARKLESRLTMMIGSGAQRQFQEAGLLASAGDNHLRLGAVKIILHEATGRLYPSQLELNEQVLAAHRAGFQVAIHAVEPGTVEAAITALEFARSQLPGGVRRHRIEHCAECPPNLLERLTKLGTVVVTQPPFLYYSGERYLAEIPPARLRWLYRFRSFLDGGLVVAGSSDSPIVPADPLAGLYAAVTRRAKSGQVLLPEERITAGQALAMYTTNAAYASFAEMEKGSIRQGRLADLVLLSDDPTMVPAAQIKDIKIEMTIIGGKVVWERG
ncbi:MAG: amidohydrolase [Chloroflexi bacterium]|nr:amidohydrolase [Chloroflexota bacterium]